MEPIAKLWRQKYYDKVDELVAAEGEIKRLNAELKLEKHYHKAYFEKAVCIGDSRLSLFDAIKHGDKKHQDWLEEAIDCHFDGRLVPKEET